MFSMTSRVALVTGAGQNVGEGIARLLAKQGASVGVNDLFPDRAEEVAQAIRAEGGTAQAAAFDVTDPAAVASGVEKLVAELGPVDVLVNNAGVPPGMGVAQFVDMDPAEWAKYVDLNLFGVLHCARAVVAAMCERGWGRVITISSGAGQTGLDIGVSLYAAGKGAALSFMRHLAMEVGGKGVTVNSVSLGLIDNHQDPRVTASLARKVPVGRLGQPQDIAPAVLFLASEEAGWITGQTLGVNGGSLMN